MERSQNIGQRDIKVSTRTILQHTHTHKYAQPFYFHLLFLTYRKLQRLWELRVSWGYSSEVERLPNMHKALGSILNMGAGGRGPKSASELRK